MLLLELAQRDVKGCWYAASLSAAYPHIAAYPTGEVITATICTVRGGLSSDYFDFKTSSTR